MKKSIVMAEPIVNETSGRSGSGGRDDTDDRMPRWVKIGLLAAVVIVVVFVIVLLMTGHGPGDH